MVHVTKCPMGTRGQSVTEFYKMGKPQRYCYGNIDPETEEPWETCRTCKDYCHGEQCNNDFKKALEAGEVWRNETN